MIDDSTWFLLWCRDCGMPDRAPMVFDSAAERGSWCAAHTKGTGHDRWRVKDEPAGPAAEVVARLDSRPDEPFRLKVWGPRKRRPCE